MSAARWLRRAFTDIFYGLRAPLLDDVWPIAFSLAAGGLVYFALTSR